MFVISYSIICGIMYKYLNFLQQYTVPFPDSRATSQQKWPPPPSFSYYSPYVQSATKIRKNTIGPASLYSFMLCCSHVLLFVPTDGQQVEARLPKPRLTSTLTNLLYQVSGRHGVSVCVFFLSFPLPLSLDVSVFPPILSSFLSSYAFNLAFPISLRAC